MTQMRNVQMQKEINQQQKGVRYAMIAPQAKGPRSFVPVGQTDTNCCVIIQIPM